MDCAVRNYHPSYSSKLILIQKKTLEKSKIFKCDQCGH